MIGLGLCRKFIYAVKELFFPRKCASCNRKLIEEDVWLCIDCLIQLPRTNYHLFRDNPLEQRFYGQIPIERAAAYFHYSPKSNYHHIIHLLKYYDHKKIGIYMGRCMASYITDESNFFDDIDCIIPIPLAKERLKQRGYNQCSLIANGVSEITGIPIIEGMVERIVNNPTQTRQSHDTRWKNAEGIFQATPTIKQLKGKHIMLIDDICTTGATLTSCAKTIATALNDCRISILVLAVA